MKLTKIQRFLTHLSFFALFCSGLVWVVFNFLLDSSNPFRFLNLWSLKIHGFFAFVFLISFGMILSTHISFNLRVKKNRRPSGIILTIIFCLLIISGYLLYYSGDEMIRNFSSYFHLILGFATLPVFIVHFLKKTSLPKTLPTKQKHG